MSSVDTRPSVVIEAPIGTGTTVITSDGKSIHIPFTNEGIDWKAFEEAINKINKLRKAK